MTNKPRFVVHVAITEQIYVGSGQNGFWADKKDGYSSWSRIGDMESPEEAEELSSKLHDRANELIDWTNPKKEFDLLKK